MSFDASLKVQRGSVSGLLRHNGRDVDCELDQEVRHSNKDIDPDRTLYNVTMVTDGHGGWRECTALSEITDALDNRLANVKKTLRKDAVVLRPLILQLDPKWYAEHPGEADRENAVDDMMDWAVGTFGADNIVYAAVHNDEASPHLHLGFTPVTPDGRLSQKDWFSGPKALREMHQGLRQHMADRGYDIDMQNRKPGKYAKRMSVDEYKDYADLQTQAEDLRRTQEALSQRAAGLTAQERALEARERRLRKAEADYTSKRERALEGLEKATTEQITYTAKVAAWAKQHGYGKQAQQMANGSMARDVYAASARQAAPPGRSMADIDAAIGQLSRDDNDTGLSL